LDATSGLNASTGWARCSLPRVTETSAINSADEERPKPAKRSRLVRILRLWPFPAIVLVALAVYGFQRHSAGGATGIALSGSVSPTVAATVRTDGRFRVGIYNIQGAVGKDDPAILAKIAQAVATTDFCGLVEVRPNVLKSDRRSQAQQIAESIGYAWLFAPAERRFWMDGLGNGVVSRLPAGPWTRLPLPGGDSDANRNVILLRPMVAGRSVNVMVSHVDRGPARVAQVAALTQLFQSLEAPVVLLADLNTDALDPVAAPLLATPGVVEPIGQRLGVREKRVDWIIARGVSVVDAGRVDDPSLSDHSFFWADLELIPPIAPVAPPGTRGSATRAATEPHP
jgi:endonuclease/exonuclease/phosphatase family metal-dependent hydrolase